MLGRGGTPGVTFAFENLELYSQAWGEQGALTGMVNWYRGLVQMIWKQEHMQLRRVKPKTKIIWGKKDLALAHEMIPLSLGLCDDASVVYFDEGSHWIQHDEPQKVTQAMLDFFK